MERKMCSWSFWLTKDGGLCVCAWESETYWDINILHPFLVPQSPIRNPKSRLKKENKSTLAICIVLFVWHLAFPDANEPMTYTQIDKLWCDACINISLCICVYNNIYIYYSLWNFTDIQYNMPYIPPHMVAVYYVLCISFGEKALALFFLLLLWQMISPPTCQPSKVWSRKEVSERAQVMREWDGMGWDGMDMGVSKKLGGFPQNGWWK